MTGVPMTLLGGKGLWWAVPQGSVINFGESLIYIIRRFIYNKV